MDPTQHAGIAVLDRDIGKLCEGTGNTGELVGSQGDVVLILARKAPQYLADGLTTD